MEEQQLDLEQGGWMDELKEEGKFKNFEERDKIRLFGDGNQME